MLDLATFSKVNRERCETSYFPLSNWSPNDWATAMAGECGEACNLLKKMRRGETVPIAEVGKELADIVTYVDLLASRLGLSLEECLVQKFNEVSKRVNSSITL